MANTRGNRSSNYAACLCSALLLAALTACSTQEAKRDLRKVIAEFDSKPKQPELALPPAQLPLPTTAAKTVKHSKVAAAEPPLEPTQPELVEYLRGKLLTLSPSDGINDNVEVKFDPSSSTLTVIQPMSRCDQYLGALSSNISWDVFDPSGSNASGRELLRLTATSVSGKTARTCFDEKGQPERGTSTNRVRLLFSLAKSEQIPGFEGKMSKAMKKLIVLSGGAEERELFQDPIDKPKSRGK